MSSIFPQPIQDKSLVNWDIRGARARYIEKEVKLYEREQKSPPIPQKHPEDYIVNTRHGPNPNVQRARQSNLEVHMPQGQSAFDIGGKKHYFVHQGQIKENRSLENPFNLPQNYDFIQPYYPRSLNVQDIDGTIPGSLGNKVAKNKEQALKIIQKEKNELQELKELHKNPYEKYVDALDKFKNEMGSGSQGDYKDRHHYAGNPDNPYAPVDLPRYNQGNLTTKKDVSQSTSNLDRAEKERFRDRNSQIVEENKKQQQEEESYKPRQFREENKPQYAQKDSSKEQEQQEYERYLEYLKQQEYEKIMKEYEQEKEKEKRQGEYRYEQGYPQRENEYQQNQNSREISLLKGQNEKRDISQEQPSYADRIREYEQRDQQSQNYRQANRQPSPNIESKRQGIQSSYKSQPNLLKLNHQSEIINHALNNISPQITKQNLGPNLNIEGYINYGKGARLNPTSMSYVGTELANKNITMAHTLLGNQIYMKEKPQRPILKDPLRYTQTQLNYQKFEKYPGEFVDILKAQGKPPTNENLFQLQYERAGAPKSTMEQLIKYPINLYEKGEANLDHYKKDSNPIPQYREIPGEYNQSTRNSAVHFSTEENKDQKSSKNIPFGAPFSYNPNEYKKKEMVALNHSKQLEKIEQSIDKVDKQIDTIQRGSPDIQQPHIKKTLNPEHYAEIMSQIRAEEEEKLRNKLEYQRFLESRHQQENFAGLGSYGDQQRLKGDPRSNQSMEYIEKYGAKGLRNLSNVRIF